MQRSFILLATTQLLSLIGSRMSGVALGLWLWAHTGQTMPLLAGAFFAEAPQALLGPLAGLLADRWDRRGTIILGDAGQAVGTLILLAGVVSGRFALWQLFLAMGLQGVFRALQGPAAESAITLLVPDELRDRANGLMQMGFPLAGVVAPALAGLLYAGTGLAGVLAVDLATFVVAVMVVARLPLPRHGGDGALQSLADVWYASGAGWRWIAAHRGLLGLVALIALVDFTINGPLEMALPYLSALAPDARTVGMLLAAMSAGAFAGAAAVTVAGRVRQRTRAILLGYVWLGAGLLAFGAAAPLLARAPVLAGALAFALMLPLPPVGALFSSLVQANAPVEIQGRVFAAAGQAFTALTPLSFLLTGWLMDGWLAPRLGAAAGMGRLLAGVGLAILVVTALAAAWRPLRRVDDRVESSEY